MHLQLSNKRVVSKASNKSRTKLDPKCKMWHFNYSSSGMQNCNCVFFLRREWGFVCLIPWRKPCLVIITAARLENHFIVCKRSLQMSQFSGQIYNISWSNKSCILVLQLKCFWVDVVNLSLKIQGVQTSLGSKAHLFDLSFSILTFSTNFCPFKKDLSGNTVWPQASGFQKLAKMNNF